jgi:predicted DNA-binding transcriptional regulator YafY
MSNHLVWERFCWFDSQVRAARYPNASHLAEHFELSSKTAQRDINFLRDRICAPLEFDSARRGYFYTHDSFELPRFQVSPEEVLSILLARRLLTHSADGMISRSIQMFGRKLLAQAGHPGLTETVMDECFSAVWNAYSPTQSEIFQKTADALLCGRTLEFTYHSPTGQKTRRIVEPHHLQHYMASWVLIAWCRKRSDWRKFYLARISGLSALDEQFEKKPASVWNHLLEGGFGIFQGNDLVDVRLRFSPFRAGWIREQTWHPAQKIQNLSDGSLELTLPVADFREIRMRILQFGADVEVIGPAELRKEVAEDARRLTALYEKQPNA